MRLEIFKMSKQVLTYLGLIFSWLLFSPVCAQPHTGQFINASIGFGICAPYYETDVESNAEGTGFYAQAEYVYAPVSWLGLRPYVGVIIASGESEENEIEQYRIKSNAALIGMKIRLAAPIPYVAPFIESGIGASFGSFETYTEYTNRKKNGIIAHIPLSLGLAVGRNHNYEIKFSYYYQPSVNQFSGAAALGFTFTLDDN